MKPIVRIITTGVIVLAALGMIAYKYLDYVKYPWTRDGLVRALVVEIVPRLSGPLVRVPIQNNQLVKKGDLLFEIDPSTFQANVDLARAQFDNMRDIVKSLVEQVEGLKRTVEQRQSEINEAKFGVEGSAAQMENARIALGRAKELIAEKCDTYLMHGDPPERVGEKIADLRERRARHNLPPMKFGVAGYAIVRETEREAQDELRRITDVQQSAAGYANYQQWLAGTQLEQRVSLEDYSVSNRGLRSGLVGTAEQVAERVAQFESVGVDLLLLQFSPQLEEMERFSSGHTARFFVGDVELILFSTNIF